MLESRQLRYFIAVAEQLHFGRASDKLDIAQSALSRHIKELERALGVRLFNRGRRSAVSLTEPGKALLSNSIIGVRQLERAAIAARQAARGQIGRVAVGYVVSAALSGVLPRTLERYHDRHEDVSIEVTAMETPAQLAGLEDGLLDVGFLRPRSAYPDGVIAHVVHRETMLLALAANHPLANKRIDLKNLSDQRFIIPQFDENTGFAEQLAQLASQGGFEPKTALRVRDFLTAITLAAGGYGVVPVPKCMLSLRMRNIIFKSIHGYTGIAELAVAYRARRASAAVSAFVDETQRANERLR